MSAAESRSLDRVETPRMRGERLCAAHAVDLAALHSDPLVMATLGGLVSEAEMLRRLAQQVEHWEAHGFGLWAMFDRESGAFVGRGGLRRVEVFGRPEVEIAYAFAAAVWGRGLATELALASAAIGFRQLNLESIVSFTMPTNGKSRRVMEKTGLRYERDFEYAGLPHVLYRMTRDEWLARSA